MPFVPYSFAPSDALRPRRRSWDRPSLVWSLLFAAVLMGAVYASDPLQPTASRAAASQVVQQVVQQQMRALATQDAMQAFALADTDLRLQFGTADAFLATVREQYPMLLHPASVLFLKPETDGTIAMQKVRLTDEEGSSWSLTYLLNRQHDDQWRISGCLVTPQGRQILT
jgi:hypothetical protein